ncbi:MAG: hypothetical protein WDA47_00275 [Bacilli bacterium]
MKLIILEKNEKLIAEEGYITQKGDVVDRFFAKEMHAKTINIDNYREATAEEKEAYENSLLNANRL